MSLGLGGLHDEQWNGRALNSAALQLLLYCPSWVRVLLFSCFGLCCLIQSIWRHVARGAISLMRISSNFVATEGSNFESLFTHVRGWRRQHEWSMTSTMVWTSDAWFAVLRVNPFAECAVGRHAHACSPRMCVHGVLYRACGATPARGGMGAP
jgi:hypothetical protein